jgi:hypothetical protein
VNQRPKKNCIKSQVKNLPVAGKSQPCSLHVQQRLKSSRHESNGANVCLSSINDEKGKPRVGHPAKTTVRVPGNRAQLRFTTRRREEEWRGREKNLQPPHPPRCHGHQNTQEIPDETQSPCTQ